MTEDVLFICIENAGRSQMTEAFFRKFVPEKFNVSIAGTIPSFHLNPIVIQVMSGSRIDVTKQIPKLLSNFMIKTSFKTLNMECMDKESRPSLFVKGVLDWNIFDSKEKSLDEVQIILDAIKSK